MTILPGAEALAAALTAPDPGSLGRRFGVVTAVGATTADVTIGGLTIPGIRRLTAVYPAVGDVVVVDFNGSDPLVIGSLASEAWTAYTPTLTASTTNPSLGTGPTQLGRFTRIGRTVIGTAKLKFGTSPSAGSGFYRVSLPFTPPSSVDPSEPIGGGYVYDSSADALTTVQFFVQNATTTTVMFFTGPTGAYFVTGAIPFTFAASDQIVVHFTYEAVG